MLLLSSSGSMAYYSLGTKTFWKAASPPPPTLSRLVGLTGHYLSVSLSVSQRGKHPVGQWACFPQIPSTIRAS